MLMRQDRTRQVIDFRLFPPAGRESEQGQLQFHVTQGFGVGKIAAAETDLIL